MIPSINTAVSRRGLLARAAPAALAVGGLAIGGAALVSCAGQVNGPTILSSAQAFLASAQAAIATFMQQAGSNISAAAQDVVNKANGYISQLAELVQTAANQVTSGWSLNAGNVIDLIVSLLLKLAGFLPAAATPTTTSPFAAAISATQANQTAFHKAAGV